MAKAKPIHEWDWDIYFDAAHPEHTVGNLVVSERLEDGSIRTVPGGLPVKKFGAKVGVVFSGEEAQRLSEQLRSRSR